MTIGAVAVDVDGGPCCGACHLFLNGRYNDPVDFSFWNFLDVSLIPVDILRDLSRSMGSIYALLPDIDVSLHKPRHLCPSLRHFIPLRRAGLIGAA